MQENYKTILNPRNLILFQGTYYLLTGLWPIIDIDSFMTVTGPKYDIWLVKTVGMLIVVISICLLTAGIYKQLNQSVMFLAAGAAFGFILIDVSYVYLDVIAPIYLLDACVELLLLILWILVFIRYRKDLHII